jgi:hypothetical protein
MNQATIGWATQGAHDHDGEPCDSLVSLSFPAGVMVYGALATGACFDDGEAAMLRFAAAHGITVEGA